jgi:hypothetical protein
VKVKIPSAYFTSLPNAIRLSVIPSES